jgi:ribosomal protein S18 acetylase RimI-like enzyme
MMKALEARTLLRYLVTAGPANALRMIWRSYPLQSITEAAPDEYFLAHLGVLPQFEGRGLGRKLLQFAEARARAAGLGKITLTVDADNERAIRLYRRAGFRVSGTVSLETLRRRFGYRGYHHMAKDLR